MPWWRRLKWGCHNSRSHQGSVRSGWVSRRRKSANHSSSGQREATRVMERLGVSLTLAAIRPTRGKGGSAYTSRLSQGCRNASSKTAWGSGTREQYRGSFALRRVECPRHLRVERPLGPYDLTPTAEEICQDIGLTREIPRIQVNVEILRPPEKATGQRAEGARHRAALLVNVSHNRRVVAHLGHPTTGDHLPK